MGCMVLIPHINRSEESGGLNKHQCRKHRIYQICMRSKKRSLARQYGRGWSTEEISWELQSQALDSANGGAFFQDENRKGRLSRNVGNSATQRRLTSQRSADAIMPRSKPEIIQGVSSLCVYQLLNQEKINASKLRLHVHAQTLSSCVAVSFSMATVKYNEVCFYGR